MYSRLYELAKGSVKPKHVKEIRQICSLLYHVRAVTAVIDPVLNAIEFADKAALFALAALGDQDSILELGHFGRRTTEEAIERLKRFRAGIPPA